MTTAVSADGSTGARKNIERPTLASHGFDPDAFDPNNYTWMTLVARHGDAGAAWVEGFEKTPLPGLIDRADEALFAMRRREVEKGREILDEVRAEIEKCEAEHPEWPVVIVRRWLHGTEAFLDYLAGDFDAALDALAKAEAAVRRSLEGESLLMPLAYQSIDFVVQRMRVARNERRWEELERQVDRGRAMVDDRQPLFELADGRQIFNQTVLDFYRACELSEGERRALEYIYAENRPVKRFESKISPINRPAGFVVPYH